MSEELVDLGHNGDSSLRADGLVNALTGMGTRRDKSQYTNSTPIVFLTQEELENLYIRPSNPHSRVTEHGAPAPGPSTLPWGPHRRDRH